MARYRDPYAPDAAQGGVDLTPKPAPAAPVQTMPRPAMPQMPPRYPTTAQAPYGQAGYRPPTFPGFAPTQEFAQDPTTANYENLMNFQIPYFMQPVRQTNYLAQSMPQYEQLLGTINNVLGMLQGPSWGEGALQGAYGALMSGGNVDPALAQYRDYLLKDPYTGAEGEAYQTEFMDPIASQRDQAVARTMREISDQGIDQSSGIAQAKLALTRGEYDKALAAAQNRMAIERNQRREARQGAAFGASVQAEQLKKQGQASAVSAANAAANAWENRLGQMLSASSLGNEAGLQRAKFGYDVDFAQRQEQDQNFQTAMQLAQIMSRLPSERQAEALALIGAGDPNSVLQGTGMIANQQQNQAALANQAYGNTWGGLGSLLGYLSQMFPTSGAGRPAYNDPMFTTPYLPFPV